MTYSKYIRFFAILVALFVLISISGLGQVLATSSSPGDALWARSTVVAPSNSYVNETATDASGNVYNVGPISGSGTYGFGNSITVGGAYAGGDNAYIVKYNSEGVAQWARSTTTAPSSSNFSYVTTDATGNVYVAGYISGNGTFSFGNGITVAGTFSGVGGNALVIKYNSDGDVQWVKSTVAATYASQFYGVTVDVFGDIYLSGSISRNTQYNFGGSATVTANYASGSNAVIVKYDGDGVGQWARSTTTASNTSTFLGVTTDAVGNVFVAGYIYGSGTYNLGSGVTVAGKYVLDNAAIVKYDANGVTKWAYSVTTGPSSSRFQDIRVNTLGDIYLVGYITGSVQFDFGSGVTATGTSAEANILFMKYNSEGVAQWARTTTAGVEASYLYALELDSSGDIYVAGKINYNEEFGFGDAITATGASSMSFNMVLIKYNPEGVAQWARSTTAGDYQTDGTGLAVDPSDNIYVGGTLVSTDPFSFGSDPDATVAGAYAGFNGYLVKYYGDSTPVDPETISSPTSESTPTSTPTSTPSSGVTILPETGADL